MSGIVDGSDDNFRKYVEDFGFGRATGIELDSESLGNISSLSKRGQIYSMTASFGQGITITSMQFITAFSSLINGGNLMKPYIVKKIVNEDGTFTEVEPEATRDVLTPATAATLGAMMVSVVENGHAKKAAVPGYRVAGKTGTAQVPDGRGGYGQDTIHTFAGIAPIDDPKFVMVVKFEKPQREWADATAAPIFGEIAKFALQYFQIPPSR